MKETSNSAVRIRKASMSDKNRLVEAIVDADDRSEQKARSKVESFTGKKDRLFLVAMFGRKIIGYAAMKKEDDDKFAEKFVDTSNYSHVSWIAVLQEFRKTGVGSMLLKSAEARAKAFGKDGIWLDCRENIMAFYQHNGYSVVGDYLDESGKRSFVMFKKFKGE
jgi:ribosomal protein S18 acetylase RimI-like enzyme